MDGGDKYIGRILDERYEILELIGTGGMALVYKARCHRLNRMVAIKILKEDLADDEEFQRRFYTESQAVAMLSHPNIVAVYDVSRSGSIEYIVMELIEGITLKQYINRKGLLNWKEALHFATQIIKALNHAHSRGIIHRDIKPHNIMILKDGSVKVADFGIARLLSEQSTLTQEALGSVHYISPEQAKAGHIDARSDIYSVGVVLYEMLTSRLPFIGDSAVSVAIQHISAIPLMPRDINPDVPVGLEDITMHAMEPDINVRFTTAEEMLNDLEEFRKNPGIVFNYAFSDPSVRQAPEALIGHTTRISPTGDLPKAENSVVNHERPVTPKRRNTLKQGMTSDEYRVTKTRASNTSTLVGVFCIIVFLVAVLVFMWNYLLRDLFYPEQSASVTIPDFQGSKYDEIIKNAEYDEIFNFSRKDEYSDEVEEDLVIRQTPRAEMVHSAPLPGRKINIELVVSLGETPPNIMPDLIGKHYIEARNYLIRLDSTLIVELEIVESDEIIGYVVETIPAADAAISNDYTVMIRYSGGPKIEYEIIPDLVGSTLEELEDIFEELGIEAEYVHFFDDTEEGTVLYIESVGERVALPVTIVVHVSMGPEIPPVVDVTVPNLLGSKLYELEAIFATMGLTPDVYYFTDPAEEGTILLIERVGETVMLPATIAVYVSSGPSEPLPVDPTENPSEDPYDNPEIGNPENVGGDGMGNQPVTPEPYG